MKHQLTILLIAFLSNLSLAVRAQQPLTDADLWKTLNPPATQNSGEVVSTTPFLTSNTRWMKIRDTYRKSVFNVSEGGAVSYAAADIKRGFCARQINRLCQID